MTKSEQIFEGWMSTLPEEEQRIHRTIDKVVANAKKQGRSEPSILGTLEGLLVIAMKHLDNDKREFMFRVINTIDTPYNLTGETV